MTINLVRFCKKCQAETERLANGGRCKPCSNASSKAWNAANPEKHKAINKAWKIANQDKHRASIKAAQLEKAAKFALYEAFYLANQGLTPSK